MPRRRDDDDDDIEDDEDEAPRRPKKGDGIPPGTPRVYVHKKCKGETEMPAKYIRKYLKSPYNFNGDTQTYCAGCDKDVRWKDCYWAETEQNLQDYIEDLIAEGIIAGEVPPSEVAMNWGYPVGAAVGLGLLVGAGGRRVEGLGLLAGVVAAVVGAAGGAVYMWLQHKKDLEAAEAWKRKCVSRYYKRHPEAKKAGKKKRRDDDDE